jgi:hypothetical protein
MRTVLRMFLIAVISLTLVVGMTFTLDFFFGGKHEIPGTLHQVENAQTIGMTIYEQGKVPVHVQKNLTLIK